VDPPRIVLLGGYGTFGTLIAEQLTRSDARVILAGRNARKGLALADSLGVEFVPCDARNKTSLRDAVAGGHLVINAAGPFQATDYSIPQTCIECGCHYIDLGDGRAYVAGIGQLHERAKARGVFVCVGASTTPAITSAAVEELHSDARPLRAIKVALSAGNKNQAGVSTIASILAYVGAPVRVWQDGRWTEEPGWGMGEFIDFPKPVCRRRVQLCDVPDLELFPSRFQARTVLFKAGVELTLFNYALGVLARLRRLCPSLNLPALAGPIVWWSRLFKPFGTFHGSFAVWVTDDTGRESALAFVAPRNGPRVPSAPAVLLARKLLRGDITVRGAFPCVGFIRLAEFAEYLAAFDIFVVRGENGVWSGPP
jgi:hypothetical protein